jgi:hypothetical protein
MQRGQAAMRSFFAFVIVDVSARQNEFQDKRAIEQHQHHTAQLEHLKTKEKRTKKKTKKSNGSCNGILTCSCL